MDESDHLTLVNAGDEEVVSQEEGGREGSAAWQGEKKEGVARALSLSHTCGHTGRARTVLDWVVLRCELGDQDAIWILSTCVHHQPEQTLSPFKLVPRHFTYF